ncbi:MAG: PEP-CTERM sorting domain-containing protein [Planctomycetota bacterium]
MRSLNLTLAATLVAAAAVATPASAALIASYEFNTPGATEGWGPRVGGPAATVISGLTADGDSLNATASGGNDPQLILADNLALPTGETWDTLVFRVRETGDFNNGPVVVIPEFNPVGIAVAPNFPSAPTFSASSFFEAVPSGDGFFTVTVDISGYTLPTITSLRLDPIGGAAGNSNSQTQDNLFEVDFVRIFDSRIPEPTSGLLLGLALVGGCVTRRRVA